MRKLEGFILVLLVLLMGAVGAVPARAQDDMDRRPTEGSDSRQFLGELRSGGALKFYEDTEEILRAGKFERAYIRYIFLNAHIRSSPLDRGLVPMVDQRLHFLGEQMHLGEGMQYAAEVERIKRKRVAKPVCPPPPPKEAKPKASEAEEKPPEIVIPPAPPPGPAEEKAATPPKEEAKPPAQEAAKPAPAPSTWERIKKKLLFWRKDGG